MHFSLLNIISSLTIGLIIGAIAIIKNVRLKATVYGLPFPITVALIATNGKITSDNISGLFLLNFFLVVVYLFHKNLKLHIILSDLLGAALYIVAGYILVKIINIPFILTVVLYIIIWVCAVVLLHSHRLSTNDTHRSDLSPAAKGAGTTIIALALFSLKETLSSVIVTFPYSGVFAVLEMKNHLNILARIFIRNSIAILGLFIAVYITQPHMALLASLAIGWIAYVSILKPVQKISV